MKYLNSYRKKRRYEIENAKPEKRTFLISLTILGIAVTTMIVPFRTVLKQTFAEPAPESTLTIKLPEVNTQVEAKTPPQKKSTWHPPHTLRVWTTSYKGRIFRVTQLPRCEHMETLISYNPKGETLKQAQKRLNGITASSGSFHHPQTFSLADFAQDNGLVFASARTGRPFLVMGKDGKLDISTDYKSIKGKEGISALALGQRLVPLQKDGFSVAFMNKLTDRMAIGLNNNFIFIVQGKSDIWRLSSFMAKKLPCNTAINSDGGHVIRGKAPVHVVFRWKTGGSDPVLIAEMERRGKIKGI